METTRISNISTGLNIDMKNRSISTRNSYPESASGTDDKKISISGSTNSFKVEISSNTSQTLNGQLSLMKRMGILASDSDSDSKKSDLASALASATSTDKLNEGESSDTDNDPFGENGYWGVKQTAGRISDFVLAGAGDDIEKLRIGREAVQKGLKDAEKVWGGKLPDIAYQTIDKSLELIDEKINKLGGNVVDISA